MQHWFICFLEVIANPVLQPSLHEPANFLLALSQVTQAEGVEPLLGLPSFPSKSASLNQFTHQTVTQICPLSHPLTPPILNILLGGKKKKKSLRYLSGLWPSQAQSSLTKSFSLVFSTRIFSLGGNKEEKIGSTAYSNTMVPNPLMARFTSWNITSMCCSLRN